jgi:hypothetical protein
MKKSLKRIYHFFPVQLVLLHFRKYQILLVFWLILFSTVNGHFANAFGAASLFLAPEYLGRVSFYSTFILGFAMGVFVMSWHITTFILHSKRFKFLATTTQPFFKYCINNSAIPLGFLIFLLVKEVGYQKYNELTDTATILFLLEGFLVGFLLCIFISFFYFFNADRSILRDMQRKMGVTRKILYQIMTKEAQVDEDALPVHSYLNSIIRIKRARNVDHYNKFFLESIFKKHHFAATLTVGFALVLLIIMGYLTQYRAFRVPAGASVLAFFSVLIAFSGAFVYMLRSWAIPVIAAAVLLLNWMLIHEVIDTRSKAYGMNYLNTEDRPVYNFDNFNRIFSPAQRDSDRIQTEQILDTWKERVSPGGGKPKLIVINVSGGGSRAATWTMDVLQYADSILGGSLMAHTVLITGASGGIVGASYFRELYLEKLQGRKLDLYSKAYSANVARDLLNPILSSYAVNDFFTPFLHFHIGANTYPIDRGYAFEEQLQSNLGGVLNKTIGDYGAPERNAEIPMLIYNSTVTEDGRLMIISPQPVSYLTAPMYLYNDRPVQDIDGIDFCRFFSRQNPLALRVTSAIRMCATFPYVLPNVYLPSSPIVDVMDAGLRDNYGEQTSLRFLHVFAGWINANTSGVLFIQIRDSRKNDILPIEKDKSLEDILLEPLFTLQHNLGSFQDFNQDELYAYAEEFIHVDMNRLIFEYVPESSDKTAALNWHLTSREKVDIAAALYNPTNRSAFGFLVRALHTR